jgi:phospholipid/cholesterol/gamma-HCH transport system permease protein
LAASGNEQGSDGRVDLRIDGALDRHTVPRWHRELLPRLRAARGEVRLDLGDCSAMDSAGAALCGVLRARVERAGGRLVLTGASRAATEALSVFRVRLAGLEAPRPTGALERLGAQVYRGLDGALVFGVLVTDAFHYTVLGLFTRRYRVRWSAVVEQMVRVGLQSLGIVALISLLVGLVVALQSAAQLARFGANIFIVDLIGISMTREMGPLMTAIIMAGRVGSSIAAEVATMTITEEVDALKTMGVHPVRFLVVPRFLAITATQPLLTVMADAIGILGGLIIAVTYLQLGAEPFVTRLLQVLVLKDVLTGILKSVAFAWLIVFIGLHRGFQVTGGAEGVGRATTDSVVQSIFAVIAADAAFSLIFYF